MSIESAGSAARRIRLWSLREDVLVEAESESNRLVVVTRWGETGIDDPDELVKESLRRMSFGPISLDNVLPPRDSVAWETGRARLAEMLDRLSGSVVHSLGLDDGDGPLLSAVPIARNASFFLPKADPNQPARLSRFATIRASQDEMVLESPLSQYTVVLHRQLAWQVATGLCRAVSVTELASALGLAEPIVTDVVAYLAATGIVLLGEWTGRSNGAQFDEDYDPSLIRWSHHDLLFHSRSRMGRHGGATGAVFPHAGTLPSPPLVRPKPEGPRFTLYRPPMAELRTADPPLTEVMESAQSCEDLADRQLTVEQLGELLYRSARIRSVSPASAGAQVTYRISDRPYLSIHGLHELELYVSVLDCIGLPPGMYHYDPYAHALTLVNSTVSEVDDLLGMVGIASGTTRRVPALITITARVARSSWMYQGISYSLALTHVGALQQTLHLTAAAMGLMGCVPAVDPGDAVDTALRLDWPAEVSLGEFIVGYRRVPT